MSYGCVHIPAGCEVKLGATVGALATVGVLKGDATIQITYDKVRTLGSKAEVLSDVIKNMKAVASFTLYQVFLDTIETIMGGAVTVSDTAGSIVNDHDQTIAADAYDFNEFIECEYQNSDGSVLQIDAQGYPDLSGATDGPLVHGTDYFITKNGQGKWGIIILDSATVTTMNQIFTLSYDYTPAASKTLKMGANSVSMTAMIVEFSKTISSKTFRARLWAATNTAGMTFSFPDSASDDPASFPVEMEGGLDSTKSSGEQLIEIYDELGLTL